MTFKTLAALLSIVGLVQLASAALTRRVACPDGVNTATNAACCDLSSCNAEAHEALRLVFHDAISISNAAGNVGGADGSIMTFVSIETAFHPNIGLDEVVALEAPFVARHNITPGDFIHFAGLVGLTKCPDNPTKLHDRFIDAWLKISLFGNDQDTMINCSEVIPAPKSINVQATFPPPLSNKEVEQACADTPFPTLKSAPGPATSVPPVLRNQ
ncbi:hypothetical protein EUX98_g2377 [Antrodiella citrinella]|uniref:Peroxidase n=1 Tax=Antrodiella citrinella TaxID=2447956 RepID=A0A4S4N7E0_9APHY|nr:hypothetical protein EUX98_g2377 [Antrodiella citrinella]